jgi:hypothetical protein
MKFDAISQDYSFIINEIDKENRIIRQDRVGKIDKMATKDGQEVTRFVTLVSDNQSYFQAGKYAIDLYKGDTAPESDKTNAITPASNERVARKTFVVQ